MIDAALAKHRKVRGVIAGIAVAMVGMIGFDHAGLVGSTGNDWRQFDKQTLLVVRVISGDELVVRAGDRDFAVRLLGAAAPVAGAHGAAEAMAYLQKRLANKSVTLKLEPTQTRDESHALLAYVYLGDSDDLNVDAIHDGKLFADRRVKHTLAGSFEQAESEARKKSRGLWADLSDADQPAWRRAWLSQLRSERRAATQPSAK